MLQIGSLVDNKYKVLSEVGRGGMSIVYLAINERANKTWAIKEVRKDGVCDFEAVKQGLIVETDMLKRLNHPHLPSIIDVIDTEESFLIVMDFIEGKSLQSVLKKGGAQPRELVKEWGIQLCDVLGYLHSQRPAIIYRDMKPANVMLKPDGTVTLIDFGTAREFKNGSKVEDTTCLGTRGYAAPEQFGGRGETDARTDIYCLGATLYHLLTGHSPAEPPYEIKPLSYWDPSFSGSGFEKIINKCCQQDPAARYQTCAELLYDLEHEDDISQVAIRSRNLKWNAFIGSIALCLVGVVGMAGFHFAKQTATRDTYSIYIEDAKYAESFDEQIKTLKSAMKLDPGNPEAYELLIDTVEADGVMTGEEYSAMTSCLKEKNGGDRTNIQQLQNADTAAYDKLEFRIGNLFFLMYDNSDSAIRASAEYYGNITNSIHLTDAQRELVGYLYNITRYYESLDSERNLYTDSEYAYNDLWADLTNMIQGDVVNKVGRKSYAVVLYQQVARMILENGDKFNENGITLDTMTSLLDVAENGLNGISVGANEPQLDNIRKNALNTISEARKFLTALGNQ